MTSLKEKRVNNYQIVLPKSDKKKEEKWKGQDLFDVRWFVMGIIGKRKSGKTSLIYTLLKAFSRRNTKVIFFVPTFWKDASYEQIRQFCESKNIGFSNFGSIVDEGVNNLSIMMKIFEDTPPEGENKEQPLDVSKHLSITPISSDPADREARPEDFEYIFVFDDISTELRDKALQKLVKNSRHYKAKIIISSQGATDAHPNLYSQLDYLCLFKNLNTDSLKHIFDKIEPNIDYDEFVKLYFQITETKDDRGLNSFMLIDRSRNEIRKNLDKVVHLEN